MEATIINFRGSFRTKYDNHMVLKAKGVDTREAAKKLVGKQVVWKTPSGKEIKGKVASEHGNTGAIRVIFEKGMPGQSVGTKIEVKA